MSKDNKEFVIRIIFILLYILMWCITPFTSMVIHCVFGIVALFAWYSCIEEWLIEKLGEKKNE